MHYTKQNRQAAIGFLWRLQFERFIASTYRVDPNRLVP